jgi:CubicO group peptidase (beta-lactamase class C family)
MTIDRRTFASGVFGAALGSQFAVPAFAQTRPDLTAALAAIHAYGEAHRSYFGLPGMTVGLTTPDGFSTILNFGYANADARSAITSSTLFQIGSISKSMTAALIHQLAAEGRFRLNDPISSLLPTVPLPERNGITVQHLLDHTSGLADGPAPIFPEGGLWLGFRPGEHWSYSNIGYTILGKLAEHVSGKPLVQLFADRLFRPLAMRRTRGAIVAADRSLYSQGYGPADDTIPFARGVPLAPAAWVDVTGGEGCVASTGEDMNRWMRTLADAVQGRGGLGLPPQQAKAFTAEFVPSDTPGTSYGNGLMHVGNEGRSYLHHTGGMVAYSSSFHVDIASGVGAFASSTISAFAEYRPRLLTRFAVDALTNALAGRSLPSPPRLDVPLANASSYVGRYSGPAGSFEIQLGALLTIVAGGSSSMLEPKGGEIFRTTHPMFREFSLMFERKGPAVIGASWGPASFVREGSGAHLPASDPVLARLAGRYINDNPWWGASPVVERGGKLWLGTEMPMTRIGDNLWRVGKESWSPERASFANFIDGRPQTLLYSGEKFQRHDIGPVLNVMPET